MPCREKSALFRKCLLPALITLTMGSGNALAEDQVVPISALANAPTVDGDLSEWPADGWQKVAIKPAVDDDNKNRVGDSEVELQGVISGDRVYFAARWPDEDESTSYKPWEWKGKKYKRSKDRDDMFAIRFYINGDYDRCMLSKNNYRVDVWLWSAGRTNEAGYAEDMWHLISTETLENAAEYELPEGGLVYIRKRPDDGEPIYANTRPKRKKFQGDSIAGTKLTGKQAGSVADVRAKGVWKDGYWQLELSRALTTGNEDDASFASGMQVQGAIGVFNKGYAEHKSISDTLLFDFK